MKTNPKVTDARVQVGGGPVLVPLAADRGLAVQRSVGRSELGVWAAGVTKDFSLLLHLFISTSETYCPGWIIHQIFSMLIVRFFPERHSDLNGLFSQCTVLLHKTQLVSLPYVRLSEVRVGLSSKH